MKKITFPLMGNYHIPFKYLIEKATNCEVIVPPKITKKTLEIGSKYSPDYVCVPFKYNLGNFIEALNKGATVILQAGGGCRYGYYAELQEQILKDLDYNFEFINFIENNHVSIIKVYKFCKKLNRKLSFIKYLHYLLNSVIMIISMDKLADYKRQNIGFETEKNIFAINEKSFLRKLSNSTSTVEIISLYKKYHNIYKKIELKKSKHCLKIGIVGELYSLMEPYCSTNIELKMASLGIEVHRFTTLTYLLFKKKYRIKKLLKKGKKYLKYHLGADATESVVLSMEMAKKHFDGIIHIKSFGCTPEISAMQILEKVSDDYHIPILYFSIDSQENEVAIDTRLEAFYDMILKKKETIGRQ